MKAISYIDGMDHGFKNPLVERWSHLFEQLKAYL